MERSLEKKEGSLQIWKGSFGKEQEMFPISRKEPFFKKKKGSFLFFFEKEPFFFGKRTFPFKLDPAADLGAHTLPEVSPHVCYSHTKYEFLTLSGSY